MPAKLAPVLTDLLWLAHLSVTLFWVIDTSRGQERTRQLVDRSMPDADQRGAGSPGSRGPLGLVGQVGAVLDVVVPGRAS